MEEDSGTFVRDRPDGVNKKRLSELNLDNKIAIYHKTSAKSANSLIISAFPKEALTLFSKAALDYVRKAQDNGSKVDLYQIQGGDVASLKMIFTWVQDCITQQSLTKFPDIEEPEEDPFNTTLKVIEAAELLKIPAGSLQFFLEKRLLGIARKHMMKLDQVRQIYVSETEIYEGRPLTKIACSSIFNAWWDHRFDKDIALLTELETLREELPKLDEDLHQACVDKMNEVTRKMEESKRRAQMASTDSEDYSGAAPGAGWDSNDVTATDDWNTGGTADWDKENTATATTTATTTTGGTDWNVSAAPALSKDHNQDHGNMDWADESAAQFSAGSTAPSTYW